MNDDVFRFEPPPEAEEVDSLFDAMAAGDEGPHPLVGEAAPDFELSSLDGEQVQLKQHEDNVVVLDFWATWCPPCIEGLPKVASVAKEMEEEGVVFYAVNVGEDEETVREFLDKEELSIPVLLDKEGMVGDRYEAEAIPQTVLIGKAGRIQVVHTGFCSGMKDKLREELQALLKGEDLASKACEETAAEKSSEDAVRRQPGDGDADDQADAADRE